MATKNFLIRHFVKLYVVDISDAKLSVPDDFASFNDFFIRELASGTRPIASGNNSIVAPVDGTLSLATAIRGDSVVQAKGLDYSLIDLFATDLDQAAAYVGGAVATIYLAPYNYHRVHAPWDGELIAAHYVPGDLFSVNAATAARVDGLMRRNERLIMHFITDYGPAALIFVGALHVGSISTPWSGELRPQKHGVVDVVDLSQHASVVSKGDLLGWFNMGSTVILLLPAGVSTWDDDLHAGDALRMGAAIGEFSDPAE